MFGKDGNSFLSESMNLREEYKIHEYKNGCVYEGMWRGAKRHGQGRFKWPSGSEYFGNYVNDRRHGEGILAYEDGTRYEG